MSRIVLGGGLSGLSATYYLLNRFPSDPVTLLESSERVGGWIRSTHLEKGQIFEQGPRTIRPHGPSGTNTLQLISELGLAEQICSIPSYHPVAKNRMIYVNGKLHTLPTSFSSMFFKAQAPFSKPLFGYLFKDIFTPRKTMNDESIYNFIERRLGKEIADYAISPLICGVCAGDAKEISVKFLMKTMFENEQQHGGIVRGILKKAFSKKDKLKVLSDPLISKAKNEKWSIYSFKDGLEVLPQALRSNVEQRGAKINLNTRCSQIKFNNENVCIITNNEEITTKTLISSIPAKILGNLVQEQHPKLKELLESIESVTVGVVNLKFDRNVLNKEAFGFLVPPKEELPILGVIFDSCCFPRDNTTVLTVMMGGHWFKKYFGSGNEQLLLNTSLQSVKNILQITDEPIETKVNILQECIPQYVVGHEDKVNKIVQYIKENKLPISLCGSSYYGVGVNDVILSAKGAIDDLI